MGGIRRAESGKWIVTYRTAGGAEVDLTTPARTREEAERLLHHCEMQAWAIRATGVALTPEPEQFGALWEWWRATCLDRYSATWQRTVIQLVTAYLLPAIGHLFAGEILPMDFQSHVQRWIRAGLKPRTVNKIRSIAKTIVNDAIANRRWPLVANPFSLVRPQRVPREIWPTLCADDARRLIENTFGRRRTMWALAIYLGLRRGELFALKRADFDMRRRSVVVRRSHDRETTKSGVARLLPCTDELWAIVEPYVAALTSPDALLFPGRNGGLLSRTHKFPRNLRADLARSGVEAPCTIRGHDLRHTFATLATEAGVASDVVRLTLGHAGGVTADYQHISLEAHRRELGKFSLAPHKESRHDRSKKNAEERQLLGTNRYPDAYCPPLASAGDRPYDAARDARWRDCAGWGAPGAVERGRANPGAPVPGVRGWRLGARRSLRSW